MLHCNIGQFDDVLLWFGLMTSPYLIYGLRDPETGELRYVGGSMTGTKRPKLHKYHALSGHHKYGLGEWIRNLHAKNMMYKIEILQEVNNVEDIPKKREKWITLLRGQKQNLFNDLQQARGAALISSRIKIGDGKRLALLRAIRAVQPCIWTNTELATAIETGERQTKRYLADLIKAGLVKSEVTHTAGPRWVRKDRKLHVVESDAYGNPIQQGQVRLKADA